ncbi:MAG: hypothetical protein R3C49_18500 [Planctomycetaceae bacterium]
MSWLLRLTKTAFQNAEPSERRPMTLSALWFATLLGGYYMVRPVRDALGSEGNVNDLKNNFLVVFLVMLVAVPVYSQLVSRFRRGLVVPLVYRFLILNLLLFSAALKWLPPDQRIWAARTFFVWVSVYVLFAMSLFWSVMADTFSSDQGRRLFGTIAGCGTVGALIGSAAASELVKATGTAGLLLLPAVLMEFGLWLYRRLDAASPAVRNAASEPTGGNPFAGFLRVLESPYLLGICWYILVTALCGTSLYLSQSEIVKAAYPVVEDRVVVFARVDLATQILTAVLQLAVVGRLMKFSLPLALSILPLAYLAGFTVLGFRPVLPVLIAVVVVTRSVVYGLTVPSQGVLFTVVSREDKYKSKNVIDTLVTRGGDTAASEVGSRLREFNLGIPMLSWMMIPLTILWGILAWQLGRNSLKRAALIETGQLSVK